MKVKLIAVFLVVLLVSLTCGISVLDVGAIAWDGTISTSLVGSGTEADPYQIANGADLAYLSAMVNGGDTCSEKYFKQMTDIDLGGNEWKPIGPTDKIFFSGAYDGSFFTVKNFKVTDQTYSGLFGYMNGSTTSGLKNIVVSDATISGTYSGGIVSYAIGGSYVKGCVAMESCTIKATKRSGGIASTLSTGSTASYCINNATIIGVLNSSAFYGGVVGVNGGGSAMSYCVNNGKVTAESTGLEASKYCALGGLVGVFGGANSFGNIDNSYNTGTIEINDPNIVNIMYMGGISGISAQIAATYLINDCYNFGQVKCSFDSASVHTGSFTGYIKNIGLTVRNVYALEGTALGLVAAPESCVFVDEGFDFTDKATLESKAAYINKGIIEYNEDFSAWLLNLDINNLAETTAPEVSTTAPDVSTTPATEPITDAPTPVTTITPETGTAVESTTATPVSTVGNKPAEGGCGSSFNTAAVIFSIFASVLLLSQKKRAGKKAE